MTDKKMGPREMVLVALAGGGTNAVFSPVQIQKLLFLLDEKAANLLGGPHFNFVPYNYGPFDASIYSELDGLSEEGLVEINNSGRYRRYILTREGYKQGQHLLGQLEETASAYVTTLAEWVNGLGFQQLIATIYKHYPEMRKNSVFCG